MHMSEMEPILGVKMLEYDLSECFLRELSIIKSITIFPSTTEAGGSLWARYSRQIIICNVPLFAPGLASTVVSVAPALCGANHTSDKHLRATGDARSIWGLQFSGTVAKHAKRNGRSLC